MKTRINPSAVLAAAGVISHVQDPGPGGSLFPQQVYAANEARFTEANFSEPLTQYSVGWRDPENIEEELEFWAPNVQVPRKFEYAEATNADEFMSETDDVRGVGADFKRVEYTGKKSNGRTLNKGLTMRVDLDNVDDGSNWQEAYTGRLLRRIFRNDLRRAVTLLAAAGTNEALTWDTSSGKDPDQDVASRVILFADGAGVAPTRVGYGAVSWNKRRIAHRAQNTSGGFASASLTPEQLAGYLGVRQVRVSGTRYQSAASTKTKVLPDIVVVFHAEGGAMPEDPSNIKRFWSPCVGGTRTRVYVQQINAKLVDITVEHYSDIIITSTLGIRKLTIS